jgi:hypothetical protein
MLELSMRKTNWSIMKAACHCLDFAPPHLTIVIVYLKQIKAGIVGGRGSPLWFTRQNEIDGSRFESQSLLLVQPIRVRFLVVRLCPNVGDERAATNTAWRAPGTGLACVLGSALA